MYHADDRFAEWTAAERAEYAAALRGRGADAGRPAPAAVRETLLALDGGGAPDEALARELARAADQPVV
ncbi:MAG TPA: hypothetical protein VF039_10580 [Longimicrobiales bacterium]